MKTQTAIDLAGSAANLAKIVNVTPGAISQWKDSIPENRKWQLMVLKPLWFKQPRKAKAVS